MQLIEAMKAYRDAGLCPIPVKGKRPMIKTWTSFQQLPTDKEIESWAGLRTEDGDSLDGVGLVTGRISGGLICLDVDTKNDPTNTMFKEFLDLVKEMGGSGIVDLCVGQQTPSGGYHMVFRCPEIHDGNQVFARAEPEEKGVGKAVIETRGQGGQFVAYPSPGYGVFKDSLTDVRTLTMQEAELLFSAARAIDRTPLTNHQEAVPPSAIRTSGEITPIDDYNARATIEDMQNEIEAAGFVQVRQRGENVHFRRPGKTGRDTSATLHTGLKRFYVFSSSTQFEAGKAYSPAALQCFLHNNGNWSDTARALRKAGYGSPRPKPSIPATSGAPAPNPAPAAVAVNPKEGPGAVIVPAEDIRRKVSELYRRPFDPGESLGWKEFDKLLRLRRPRLGLITGIPGSGKSSFWNQAWLNLAFMSNWRIAIFSPESASPADHLADLCEIRTGKPFYGPNRMTQAEADKAAAEISERIIFIDQHLAGVTFDHLLQAIATIKPDAVLLDPWNRIMHTRPEGVTETEFIGACLSKAAALAKALNLSFWIVAHPQKIRRDKDGNQIRPGLYDVSGSANWANMIDVGIVVWRNYERGSNEIEILKVRHKRDGEPGLVEMKFDKETGRFRPWENADNFTLAQMDKGPKQVSGKRVAVSAASSLPAGDGDE